MAVDTRLYEILGVLPTASLAEIKKAYRKLVLVHHPDKGGDAEKFQEITAAHEVLSSEEMRALYDRYGEEGLRQSQQPQGGAAGGGVNANDIFSAFFGGEGGLFEQMSGRQQKQQARQSNNLRFKLQVTLEQAFTGCVRKVKVRRSIACGACQGSGIADASAVFTCPECSGAGARYINRRMGNLVQRLEVTCHACQGAGRRLSAEAVCRPCSGQGTQQEEGVHDVQIPAGIGDGHRIILRGRGDQVPGQRPSDLHCFVQVLEHPRFQRLEEHLVYRAEVPLVEALGGCKLSIEQLDGQTLSLRTPDSAVVSPDSRWRLKGHGMPLLGQPASRGDLHVQFDVVFPESLDMGVSGRIRALLSAEPGPSDPSRHAGVTPPQAGRPPRLLGAVRAAFESIWGRPAQAKPEEEYFVLEQLSSGAEREGASRRPRSKL